MKVLYLNSGNLFGGIETLLVTLAQARGAEPEMIPEFAVCFEGKFAKRLREEGVAVTVLGEARMSRPWQVWKAQRRLRDWIRQRRPDIGICHGSWSQGLLGPVLRTEGVPLVYWTHDRVSEPLPWQERWAQRTPPDLVIANSAYTASGQGTLYKDCPQKVIYCALTPPRRRHSEEERRSFREKVDTDPDSTVIVQVSRLDPHKGHRIHLEALAKLRDLTWTCWIVAGPQRPAEAEYLRELRAQAAQLGIASKLRFLGWQESIDIVFDAADIFCQPNTGAEPFGLTFVEALWREKPVVTSAMAGALEVLTPECGLLCPPGDVEALANALRSLVTDPGKRKAMGANGPARAKFLCDPPARLAEIREALESVVQQSQGN